MKKLFYSAAAVAFFAFLLVFSHQDLGAQTVPRNDVSTLIVEKLGMFQGLVTVQSSQADEAAGNVVKLQVLGSDGTVRFSVDEDGDVVATSMAGGVTGTATTATTALGIRLGASPPATCAAGEIFLDTDETVDTVVATTADNSLILCVSTNTYAVLENN